MVSALNDFTLLVGLSKAHLDMDGHVIWRFRFELVVGKLEVLVILLIVDSVSNQKQMLVCEMHRSPS